MLTLTCTASVISEHGSALNAGFLVDKRDRVTRKVRWEQLEDDLTYVSAQLDRDVVAPDQIRTIIRTFKERLFTEILPGRTVVASGANTGIAPRLLRVFGSVMWPPPNGSRDLDFPGHCPAVGKVV